MPGVIDAGWFRELYGTGFSFPDSYLVFDVETSGLSVQRDYILQLGLLVVENRVAQEPVEVVFDWTRCPLVEQGGLRQKIYETEHDLKKINHDYKFTYERLARDGIDPIQALEIVYAACEKHQCDGCTFLTHNGVRYDSKMVGNHFARFLDKQFTFDDDFMIDTGLLEKARQLQMLPGDDESLTSFYDRVSHAPGSNIFWSLSNHCIPRYGIAENYDIDISRAHNAGYDCYMTHLLMEEMRKYVGE